MKNNLPTFNSILDSSILLLLKVFVKMREANIEMMRTNEVAAVLMETGLQKDKSMEKVLEEIIKYTNDKNISEMMYSAQLLSFFPELNQEAMKIIRMIKDSINENGGIGRFVGDRSRIPVSWRVLESFYLNKLPYDKHIKKIETWMEEEWSRDMKKGGLSYKCAGILIANSYYPYFSKSFIETCVKWLLDDQNEDGGWGPKKASPIGSIPSDTALTLRALSNCSGEEVNFAIKKGISWLIENRLESGFWKEHPVEKPLMHVSIFLNKSLKNESRFH